MAKFFLDPGHGGKDSGAVANGFLEKTINLTTAFEVKRLLELNGQIVQMSRTTDVFVELNERSAMANRFIPVNNGSGYVLSIHHNAGGGDGYEVIHSIYHGRGDTLAGLIAEEFRALGQNAHGVGLVTKPSTSNPTTDYFALIRQPITTSVITEFCFMDSKDIQIADTNAELMAEARAIAKACLRMVGVTSFITDVVVTPPPVVKTQPVVAPAPVVTPVAPTVMYREILDGKQVVAIGDLEKAKQDVTKAVEAGKATTGIVQRNTDGANLFTYSLKRMKVISKTGLNIRDKANGNKIGLVNSGEYVSVLEVVNSWAKIKYGSGTAYCSAGYLV